MLSEVIQTAINAQINCEFCSAYYYVAVSAYYESVSLPGFAHWVRAQSQEETEHAMKLFRYVYDRGGTVELKGIEEPAAAFTSPLDAFEKILEREREVSQQIHELYELAVKQNDYPTQVQLQWFIQEQVEEEKTASTILEQLKRVGDRGGALIMLDRHLASR